jgi:GntR family transcriptional repressor for pyruvate dehydrogenase complex
MAVTDDREHSLAPSVGAGAITSRLRRAITSGVYADGDRIPPERQLATAFGAARSTVRKALDQLDSEGLLVRRVGAGTFVCYSGPLLSQTGEISDLISPLQLIDARLAVEPYMARLAALHATQREIDGMQTVLTRLETAAGDNDLFTKLDSEFHLCIARGARNPLLLHVYETINAVRTRAQWNTVKEKVLSPRQIAAYNRQHRAIYEAMTIRDAQRVADLLIEHLDKARSDLVGAHSA